mmetsp:Transcript_133178/g.230934  ORF Transcript_133178/g.230934 Transcript_133178/m.230934 type:complete len:244 (+) Transcript_133178:721-1452(+)
MGKQVLRSTGVAPQDVQPPTVVLHRVAPPDHGRHQAVGQLEGVQHLPRFVYAPLSDDMVVANCEQAGLVMLPMDTIDTARMGLPRHQGRPLLHIIHPHLTVICTSDKTRTVVIELHGLHRGGPVSAAIRDNLKNGIHFLVLQIQGNQRAFGQVLRVVRGNDANGTRWVDSDRSHTLLDMFVGYFTHALGPVGTPNFDAPMPPCWIGVPSQQTLVDVDIDAIPLHAVDLHHAVERHDRARGLAR